MALLISYYKEKLNIANLSGETKVFSFSSRWQEKLEDRKTKEATKRFIDTEPLFIFLQSRGCDIVNKEEVSDFLNNHTGVMNYLYEAPDIVRKKFNDSNLNLELFFDPESEGDEGELFLNIETDYDVKKARKKLKEIDKEWLLSAVNKDIGKFNLNLEFI